MVTKKLGYYKSCAHWVLKLLTNDHKTKRMSSTIHFFSQYHLDRIVTADATWIAYVNPYASYTLCVMCTNYV